MRKYDNDSQFSGITISKVSLKLLQEQAPYFKTSDCYTSISKGKQSDLTVCTKSEKAQLLKFIKRKKNQNDTLCRHDLRIFSFYRN